MIYSVLCVRVCVCGRVLTVSAHHILSFHCSHFIYHFLAYSRVGQCCVELLLKPWVPCLFALRVYSLKLVCTGCIGHIHGCLQHAVLN